MKVSIIIVTYNGERWIEKCLRSINTDNYDVIVIDNNSTDNTIKLIKQFNPTIKIFAEKKNLGFGQGNNKGISYALKNGADYIFLLNQDAYLFEDTIKLLLEAHRKNLNYGILSPLHLNAKKTRLDENFSNYLSTRFNKNFYSDFILNNKKCEIYDVPFVNAAGWLLPRETLIKVGGFDPIFFHYGEDNNYCQRLTYHKFKIGIVPDAKMIHDRENRTYKVPEKYSAKSYEIFERKLKVKFADPNLNNYTDLKSKVRFYKKAMVKSALKLDFSEVIHSKKMISITKKVLVEIDSSLENNKKVYPNYLNL